MRQDMGSRWEQDRQEEQQAGNRQVSKARRTAKNGTENDALTQQ
jgi:hypothetical protein